MSETCCLHPDTPGFIVDGYLLPNPLRYAREVEAWGAVRQGGAAVGLQHSDLNANNILAKFSRDDDRELEGYYLIDFALFKGNMPLLEGNVVAGLDGVNILNYFHNAGELYE